jgi:hypothetical protein
MTTTLSFVEELIQQGRILPRQRAGLAAFLATLDESGMLEFAEPGENEQSEPLLVKASARSYIHRFLKELPVHVEYQERSAEQAEQAQSVAFSAPEGYSVDATGLEMHRKILAYAREHNLDFATALMAANQSL